MSRAATVNLQFTTNLSEVDQLYEAFVRKTARPIPLNFSGTPGAGGTPGATTFANAAAPGAVPFTGGAGGELQSAIGRQVAATNAAAAAQQQYASAILRVASAVVSATPAPVQGGGGWTMGTGTTSGYVPATAGYAGTGGGGGTPVTMGGPEGVLAREDRQRSSRSLLRVIGVGAILHSGAVYARETIRQGAEERLAIGSGGGVDLQRQYAAQTHAREAVENSNPFAMIGGAVHEWFTGDKEAAGRSIQQAEAAERRVASQKATGEYRLAIQRKTDVAAEPGEYRQALKQAEVDRQIAEKEELDRHNEAIQTNRGTGVFNNAREDVAHADANAKIKQGFDQSVEKLGLAYSTVLARINDDLPSIALRAVGRDREADRLSLVARNRTDVEAERDPGIREARRERGGEELLAFDTQNDIHDRRARATLGSMTKAYLSRGGGDEYGELFHSQQARRNALDPNDPVYQDKLKGYDAQDYSEWESLKNRDADRTSGLRGDASMASLLAKRQPYAARAEDIYQKATLASEQADRSTRPEDARLLRDIGVSQLAALREQMNSGGQGGEVGSGAFGVGGTESKGLEDLSATLKSIDEKMSSLNSEMSAVRSVLTGTD